MSKKRPELAGEFSEPIVRPDPLLLALLSFRQSEKRQRLIKQAQIAWPMIEQLTRIQIIGRAYGIEHDDPNFWMKLSVYLCNEFIEETRIHDTKPRGPGAPKKNSTELWKAVRSITDTGIATAEACKRLSDSVGPWKGKPWKTIEARFYEMDRRMADLKDLPATPFMDYVQSILAGELDGFDDIDLANQLERSHHRNSHN